VDDDLSQAGDRDFKDLLGITKWVPPIPVHMSGQVEPAPDLIRWIEIEDIKRFPGIFMPGEPVTATEKLHGTACLYSLVGGESHVSSKGFGARSLALSYDPANLYWRAIEAYDVPARVARIAELYGAERVGVFGEVFGRGIQDLAYGANGTGALPGYASFEWAVVVNGAKRWLDPDEAADLLIKVELPAVPRLYSGPYDEAALLDLATGRESVSGTSSHLREGLVVRPASERYSPILGGRAIAKFVSPAYLTRKGGTEYE
jgi:RNA ligase (TIGR02306 family)